MYTFLFILALIAAVVYQFNRIRELKHDLLISGAQLDSARYRLNSYDDFTNSLRASFKSRLDALQEENRKLTMDPEYRRKCMMEAEDRRARIADEEYYNPPVINWPLPSVYHNLSSRELAPLVQRATEELQIFKNRFPGEMTMAYDVKLKIASRHLQDLRRRENTLRF